METVSGEKVFVKKKIPNSIHFVLHCRGIYFNARSTLSRSLHYEKKMILEYAFTFSCYLFSFAYSTVQAIDC